MVTHAQADHDGGAAAVLGALPVALVLDGRDGVREANGARMAAAAARRRVRLVAARAGEVLRVGGDRAAGAVAAAPGAPSRGRTPTSARSSPRPMPAACARCSPPTRSPTCSAGSTSGPVDVLKVSHHGSADPGLPALLQRLRPRLAAIEVGRRNVYGHPAAATVRALPAAGAAVVRTDRDGSVSVEPAAGALRIHAHA